ncbi:UvrD-helicase domain-containing protein [Aminobacter ciceronei]|uniref:DNA 3'-5' helicase II n=1 Tax=Aminobacter ciceronei TaxID=150723 RepID=A0ABR6C948_9HYPH|nr:UvrD-helicase domain-containing protein [Aminobacter ciceronei]MBA8907492.1 DNA helicase-2/ATP-dependent DNA helicase PcrA [Aminobacter ciceronei]MBA9021246.1 DNA helicase-2/ATP-dependent DNA helicase PcrA [Aminobacter ciceronei]
MDEILEEAVAELAAGIARGSVIAAAGCGKTEQIVNATLVSAGRRLILTHTHAGVDALRWRMDKKLVPKSRYRIETIAGWCLRYAASFPARSGIHIAAPRTDADWQSIYDATVKLLDAGTVTNVLRASYGGLFVDEYQDCTQSQHKVIDALAQILPTCVFGDPMQAIFSFGGQVPVSWDADVFPSFPKITVLQKPHRWLREGNKELADWLSVVRFKLEAGESVDLEQRPACVDWQALPADAAYHRPKIVGSCKALLGPAANDGIIVIADAKNAGSRSGLAKMLGASGFTNIEPVECKTLAAAVRNIGKSSGEQRLEFVMGFISDCMTGAEETPYLKAVVSHRQGGKLGQKKFGDLIATGIATVKNEDLASVLALMEGFRDRPATTLYRREMYHAMASGLRLAINSPGKSLSDAIWDVQNRIRHAGRIIPKRSIGSTLLVKGLQFDRAVIVANDAMNGKDWYVALTRASKGVTILSTAPKIHPAVQAAQLGEAAE